jgi:hypothetical protein
MSSSETTSALMLFLIFLTLIPLINMNAYIVYSEQVYLFRIVSYAFRSSTGGDIYPGSSGAVLVVDTQYIGIFNVTNTYACINLPKGFKPVETSCSVARDYDNNIVYEISEGEIVRFRYTINIDKNVTPGTYTINMTITYVYDNVLMNETHILNLTIKNYPPLRIAFIQSYLTPYDYPGSNPVSLVIELENTGKSTIRYGDLNISLPNIISPRNIKASINNIVSNQRFTITLNNLAISPYAKPGRYNGTISINAQLLTSDGVAYNDSANISFVFSIEKPPRYNYTILDYGLTTNHPVPSIRNTRFYVTYQSIDQSTIDTLIAFITLENGHYINGSNTSLIVVHGPINYGDVFTITSNRFVVEDNASYINVKLEIHALVINNGVRYWVNWSNIFNIKLNYSAPLIGVLTTYWSNQKVYPGSKDQTLNIIIYNYDDSSIVNGVAYLYLDTNTFYPSIIVRDGIVVDSNNIATIRFSPIDIANNAKPGNYTGRLVLDILLRNSDGSYVNETLKYTVITTISNPMIEPVRITSYKWSNGAAYNGMSGASLIIYEEVVNDVTIDNMYVEITYPENVFSENTMSNYDIYYSNSRRTYGEIFSISFNNIDIKTNNSLFYAVLHQSMLIDIDGSQTWINKSYVITLPIKKPILNISIIDKGWSTLISSNYTENTGLYVALQSLSLDTITSITAKLYLPKGVYSVNNESILVESINREINYLDVFTIRFNGLTINTPSRSIVFKLFLNATLRRGGVYVASKTLVITLYRNTTLKPLILLGSTITYNGEPAKPLPNSYGLTISFTFTNIYRDTISLARVELITPKGFEILGSNTVFIHELAMGASSTISYHVNIGNIVPGEYDLLMKIKIYIRSNGALIIFDEEIPYKFIVENPYNYVSKLIVIDKYWGTTVPTIIYPGNKRAPLTITFLNLGPYNIYALRISLKPLDKNISVLNNDQVCEAIGVGGVCRVTFYLDLENTSSGSKYFIINTSYLQRLYGSVNIIPGNYSFTLNLPSFRGKYNGSTIYLISAGWSNDWPVYPGTRKAIYTVTLANLEPYSIGSIILKLETPRGLVNSTPYSMVYYVNGPIASLQTFTASFTLNVLSNVKPGTYYGSLIIDYYVYANNGGYRKILEVPLLFKISDPNGIFSLIQYGWLGGQPPLRIHGAKYYFVLRNNVLESMSGIILKVKLPENITSVQTNTTIYNTTPQFIIPAVKIPAKTPLTPQYLTALLQQAQTPQRSIGKGDYLSFILELNLYLQKPVETSMNATISFIDPWGSLYKVNISIPFITYGKPLKLVIKPKSYLVVFHNNTGYVDIVIHNKNITPIYDAYLVLIPKTMNAIPIDNTRYLGMIRGNGTRIVRYRVMYNPASISYAGYSFSTETAVFIVAVIYRDMSGMVSIYNTSIATRIAPFIDVELAPGVNVKYGGGLLVVNGLLINYGVSQARSVYVEVRSGNSSAITFIGDIDAASQAAFRIELKTSKPPHNITLIIGYRDNYNVLYVKKTVLPVTIYGVKTTTPLPVRGPNYTLYYVIVIIAVGVFLTATFFVLHRYVKHRAKI